MNLAVVIATIVVFSFCTVTYLIRHSEDEMKDLMSEMAHDKFQAFRMNRALAQLHTKWCQRLEVSDEVEEDIVADLIYGTSLPVQVRERLSRHRNVDDLCDRLFNGVEQ